MQRRSTRSCELTQEKRTCTLRPQEGKQGCKLMLSTICLGEKAKEGMNLVEILPPANQKDKKSKPITTASLQASVLPMAVTMGFEISPPVTFQLQAGSGPVVLSGQEYHYLSWEEEEEEDVSLEEESPFGQAKRPAPQRQTSVAEKKRVEEEEEAARPSLKDKSLGRKAKPTSKPKKLESTK